MTTEGSATPAFQELQSRGQDLLSELAALQQAMLRELAALQQAMLRELAGHQEELRQSEARQSELRKKLDALVSAEQQWTAERKTLRNTYENEARELQDRLKELASDNEALQAYQLQWAVEREEHLKAKRLTATRQADLEKGLQSLQEENENLKALHSQVAEPARKLAADWVARRQTLAAENQRLHDELDQTHAALESSRQREKQWQGQVWKLQEELRTLRDATRRMTLTDEQSHHLLSQLNAIIGFSEVLLDEGGSRTTGEEREEFLHDIKDSGTHLADYVHQLAGASKDDSTPAEPASTPAPAEPAATRWAARTILVAGTDAEVRERSQDFLTRAGYHVEFAADADEALNMAVQLQPLAIMIDTEVAPKGADALIDALLREPRAREIPVVLTVKNKEEPLGVTIGHVDFLTKPLNRPQMLQMMVKYDLLADRRRATKMPASVLVIDDDVRNTRLVKAILKPYKVSVLEADGGAAGIKLALKSKPDLIILDLMMPNVDGFQVVSALRNDDATSQIPILIYTAKTITSDDHRKLQDSIQAIVRKGELSKEKFLELVYRRGERRNRSADGQTAA